MKALLILNAILSAAVLFALLVFGAYFSTELAALRSAQYAPNAGQPVTSPSPGRGVPTPQLGNVKAKLVVIRGAKEGWQYLVCEGENIIGRADEKPVEIDLDPQEDPQRVWSSRQHAKITCSQGAMSIEDLSSANGTFLNRKRVYPGKRQSLEENDIIQIGEIQLKVVR